MMATSSSIGNYPGLRPLVPSFYRTPLRVAHIVHHAAKLTGYSYSAIIGSSRQAPIVRIRWAIMLAMRKRGLSTPQIGRMLGKRDHSTVMHGLERAEALLTSDDDFAALVSMVTAA